MDVEILPCLRGQKKRAWEQLLRSAGLEIDPLADSILLIWQQDRPIATGSRRGNLLKCIAVDEAFRGQDLTATVLSHLRQDALENGFRHLFLYTKPENKQQFSALFFYPVAQTDSVLLMENQPNGISAFLETLPYVPTQGVVGSMVMNCNPFTLGHRYLIETAAKDCDRVYVFILSEDRSDFSAEDRLEMARLGTADLGNVTVLPTGPYLISNATFPTYFLKDQAAGQSVQCRLDAAVFGMYYAPKLGITRRYVGTEPSCAVTAEYNRVLKETLPTYGVALQEIQRLTQSGKPVSASAVRSYLSAGQLSEATALLPETTCRYLRNKGLL